MEPTSNNPNFDTVIKKFFELPVWVKQVFYLYLKEEFENLSIMDCLNLFSKKDCLQLYVPKLTFMGKKELTARTKGLSPEIYKLLLNISQELSIIEIAIANSWSLAECSGYFITALSHELVIEPESKIVKGTALYLCDLIRIGEYFVKLGKVELDQLNESLKAQKYIEETIQDRLKIGKILIDLGLTTTQEIEGIFSFKEDCKKRYSPGLFASANANKFAKPPEESSVVNENEKIAALELENKKLKERLNKLLNIH